MKYVQLALWAFVVLWQHKTIPLIDRLRLWRKTMNLFACFLAFTDSTRPYRQLRGAMLCAILSTLYDYETDWKPVECLDDSRYLHLLEQETKSSTAYTLARNLFISDRVGKLSEDGLERGSVALMVYHALIQSEWMQKYSNEELVLFGRRLQIIDDLLDLEEDAQAGDKNCLLLEQSGVYLRELREFLESNFFRTLEIHSRIYRELHRACLKYLGVAIPDVRGLIPLTRPLTGIFAFVLTCVGFKLIHLSWLPAITYGFAFAGITSSVMVFNDICDWRRDILKGKRVVYEHPNAVRQFWRNIRTATGILLGMSVLLDWKSTLLCGVVWGLGLLYSHVRLGYPWNILLVALCSGSPILVGVVYHETSSFRAWLVFGTIASTIMVTECVKDIQDRKGDKGYKDTLATRTNHIFASVEAILLCYVPVTLLILYPNLYVRLTSVFFGGVTFYMCMGWYTHKEKTQEAERIGDVFLSILLIMLWFTE